MMHILQIYNRDLLSSKKMASDTQTSEIKSHGQNQNKFGSGLLYAVIKAYSNERMKTPEVK